MYLCIVLLRNHILLQSESDAWSELLSPLLLGHVSEQAAFTARAADRGLRLEQPHRLLAIAATDDQAGATAVHWALSRIARSSKPHAIHGILGDYFVFILPCGDHASNAGASIGTRAIEEIRRTTGRKPIVVKGDPCRALSDYAASWRRIKRVMGWAKEARLDGVVTASDAGPISLLADALEYKPTRDFAAAVLLPIINYDAKHSTPLMPTLVALLRSGGRLQQAAAELKIHVTTVRYRKDRISNLLNIDLDNPEDRFRFDLALRLSQLADFKLQAKSDP
jgi:sugar diacid utilization regulator